MWAKMASSTVSQWDVLGVREGRAAGQLRAGLQMCLCSNWPHGEQGQGCAVTGGQREKARLPPEATRLWAPAGSCGTGQMAARQGSPGLPQRVTGAGGLHCWSHHSQPESPSSGGFEVPLERGMREGGKGGTSTERCHRKRGPSDPPTAIAGLAKRVTSLKFPTPHFKVEAHVHLFNYGHQT